MQRAKKPCAESPDTWRTVPPNDCGPESRLRAETLRNLPHKNAVEVGKSRKRQSPATGPKPNKYGLSSKSGGLPTSPTTRQELKMLGSLSAMASASCPSFTRTLTRCPDHKS